MAWTIWISSEANQDIQNAVDYYDNAQTGLGNDFLKDLESQIEILKINPHFQLRYDNIRCLPLSRFPYLIHFSVESEAVLIWAIFHMSRNPSRI
jgi:plasmid stabilization system protein ParE